MTKDVTESMMLTQGQSNDQAFAFLKADDKQDLLEWEANQAEIERQWYDAEEEGNIRYTSTEQEALPDQELELQKKRISQPVSRRTMNSHDHDKWELNRMVTSGAMKMKDNTEVELENMESEQRVMLLVHDLKPPFLDGRENFTK